MPLKKQVQRLECLALSQLDKILSRCCLQSAEFISENYCEDKICGVHNSALETMIREVQRMLLVQTPHYCHTKIVTIIMETLSQLHTDMMSLVPVSQVDRRKKMVWKQVVSRWSSLLCVDTVTSITPPAHTDLGLILSLCHVLPDCSNLVILNLQPWSCAKHNLLNCYEDFTLMFLPSLKSLALTDVDLETIENISAFCPQLTSLSLDRSEVNDEATCCLSKLRKLKILRLQAFKNISSYGYATLLHSLPCLLTIGSCDRIFPALIQYQHCSKHQDHCLQLEEIISDSPISEDQLELMVSLCPRLSRIKIVYRPDELQHLSTNAPSHLTKLATLPQLKDVSITSADFFNHSVFSALKMLGPRLTRLELVDCDEMNIVSLIMIGEYCCQMSSLTISRCHFNLDIEQRTKINELCSLQTKHRTSPFPKLKELKFILTSPVHLIIMKYPLHYSYNLRSFSLEVLFQNIEDSFVNTLVGWSSWQQLQSFQLTNYPELTLMSANTILGSCPMISHIGDMATWGQVDRDQLRSFKQEIERRNWDLHIV